MLSHEEQSVLVDIETRVREDDPELHDLLSATEVPAATGPVESKWRDDPDPGAT